MVEPTANEAAISAQVNIFSDFNTQRPLSPRPGLPIAENQFREYVVKYSTQAFAELRDVVGLDPTKIEPIKTGNQVVLDPQQKQKMLDHLFSVTGLSNVIRKGQKLDWADPDLFTYVTSSLRAIEADLDVILTGPLVTLQCKSTQAMRLFNVALSSRTAGGIFIPMPLRITDQGGERRIKTSEVTYLNFIDLEAEKKIGQNVRQHEEWHTVDKFRELVYALELRKNPSLRINVLQNERPDKFRQRLSHYLYDPEELENELQPLKNQAPELYDYFVGIQSDQHTFELSLQKAQDEMGASIAGYIVEKNPNSITDQQRDKIVELILGGYLPFGKADIDSLKWRGKVDQETGKVMADESGVDMIFNPMAAAFGEPHPIWTAMLDKYSTQDANSWHRRVVTQKDQYLADMQMLLDFFLNEGGYGFETMEKIRRNLKQSIDSFRQLSQLREDPHRALFELSLIPISHWDRYTRLELKKVKKPVNDVI